MLLIKSSFNSIALVRLVNAVVTCIFSGLQFHSSGSVVGYHIEQENLFHTLSLATNNGYPSNKILSEVFWMQNSRLPPNLQTTDRNLLKIHEQ